MPAFACRFHSILPPLATINTLTALFHAVVIRIPGEQRLVADSGGLFASAPHIECVVILTRSSAHEDLQEFLRARYFVPPSQLYSVVRPDKYRTGYDVMVEGDWVTIAVVAERGQIMSSKSQAKHDEDDSLMEEGDGPKRPNNRPKKPPGAREGKKYTKLTLVDFGHQSKSGYAAGDAMLELLLFEADTVLPPTLDANGKKLGSPIYRGGSGGAFEEMLPSLSEKAVVAILNPRVLRPYQVGVLFHPS